MKQVLAILALAFAGTSFAAGYAGVEYEDASGRNGTSDSVGTAVILGYKAGATSFSGKVSTSQAEWGNGNISTSYEARAKHKYSVMNVNPYLGLRLGEKVSSTSQFSYYAVDTGVVVPVTGKVDVDFSYRYRNAFNTDNNFQTNRVGIEGIYKVTPTDSLGLRFARSYGDSETNSVRLNYTHSF
jgi:opacity protein-like surface antigen